MWIRLFAIVVVAATPAVAGVILCLLFSLCVTSPSCLCCDLFVDF